MAKIVVVITHGSNSDKSSVGMTIANAAKSGGHEVAVFLTSDGVYLGEKGYADQSVFRPLKPLEELMRMFLEGRGTVWRVPRAWGPAESRPRICSKVSS